MSKCSSVCFFVIPKFGHMSNPWLLCLGILGFSMGWSNPWLGEGASRKKSLDRTVTGGLISEAVRKIAGGEGNCGKADIGNMQLLLEGENLTSLFLSFLSCNIGEWFEPSSHLSIKNVPKNMLFVISATCWADSKNMEFVGIRNANLVLWENVVQMQNWSKIAEKLWSLWEITDVHTDIHSAPHPTLMKEAQQNLIHPVSYVFCAIIFWKTIFNNKFLS